MIRTVLCATLLAAAALLTGCGDDEPVRRSLTSSKPTVAFTELTSVPPTATGTARNDCTNKIRIALKDPSFDWVPEPRVLETDVLTRIDGVVRRADGYAETASCTAGRSDASDPWTIGVIYTKTTGFVYF